MPCQEREGSKARRASQQTAASLASLEGAPGGVRLLQPRIDIIQGLSAVGRKEQLQLQLSHYLFFPFFGHVFI